MKKNIHLFLIVFLFFLCNLSIKAQSKKASYEKIRTYKIAFLTEKLDLTEDESIKFWPLYNEYNKQMVMLHKQERSKIRKRIKTEGGIENLSEENSKEILDKIQAINKDKYETKASFHKKVSQILSFKKILLLQISEHEFNRELMRKLRGKKNKNKKRS